MDIERVHQQPVSPTQTYAANRAQRAQQAARGDEAGATPRGDSIEISDQARELARIRQAVEGAPEVRAEKVASIRKRIEDGTYTVSPELLARKLIEDASHDA
jgi:negative regulator of flagellin synthesis FlgM